MTELNEEFLNDETDADFPDLGEVDEEALLQDDDDVLDIIPEEEFNDALDDSRLNSAEVEEERGQRQDKFATERQRISAPEISNFDQVDSSKPIPTNNNRQFQRGNIKRGRGTLGGRGRQRGRGGFTTQGRPNFQTFNERRATNSGRNKTVLINPRFQGIVHVNNNARLAWDSQPNHHSSSQSINPWASSSGLGNMCPPRGPPMHQQHSQQMPPNMHPPMQPMNMPHQGYQNVPPFIQQQHMQNQQVPYWDGQNQYPSTMQGPNQFGPPGPPEHNPFIQSNYQSPPPIIINTSHPPPQSPNNLFCDNPQPPQQFQQPSFPFNAHSGQGGQFQSNINPFINNAANNMTGSFENRFPQKRKVMGNFVQNKKRFVHNRLGNVQQSQVKVKNWKNLKTEDRPTVVKEVTVTNCITTVKIEEDEQTLDLRQKIEEQRRKREEILRWKEKRRRENLKEVPSVLKISEAVQEVKQEIVKSSVARKQVQSTQFKKPVQQPVKINKQKSPNIVITNGYSRKFTKYQKNSIANPNRLVLVKPPETVVVPSSDPVIEVDQKHLSSFLADRKILAKDESLMPTRKVFIKNIATSTANKKILTICKNIGEVQM